MVFVLNVFLQRAQTSAGIQNTATFNISTALINISKCAKWRKRETNVESEAVMINVDTRVCAKDSYGG